MSKTLTCLVLLAALATAKIYVVDDRDLPRLLEAMQTPANKRRLLQRSSRPSHLETAEEKVIGDDGLGAEENQIDEISPPSESEDAGNDIESASPKAGSENESGKEDNEEAEEDKPQYVVPEGRYKPLICEYGKQRRFGFEVDGEAWMMGVGGKQKCKNPQEAKFVKMAKMGDNLVDCGDLPYFYTRDGKDEIDFLYYVVTSGDAEHLPAVVPGYLNDLKNSARLYMFDTVYNYRKWMGELTVFCLEK